MRKNIIRMRNFEAKYLSKVFSLLDARQGFKYEAIEIVSIENVENINRRILDLMLDITLETNEHQPLDIFHLVTDILQVNRAVKTKFNRGSKMAVLDE